MDRGYAKRKLLKKDTQKAAVFGAVLICAAAFTAALTGCVSTQAETEKIRDMKYEVIEEEDIPQSLREMIKGGEKKPFRITYSDQGFLYIAQGYEVQPTTGYSVEVKELYETETAVCIKTTLIGPKKGEEKEKAEAAKEYGEKVEEEIQDKTDELKDEEKKNVFFLFNYSDTALVTSGKNFWGQYWCDAINAVNVGEEIEAERSNASVNMEQVYSWNPEIIFISNFTKAMPEDLYNNTIGDNDWSSVSAVKNEQVYKMPLGAYRSFTPGADTPMTLMWLAKTVYPDLFEDVDMTEEVENYYKEVYNIELTDDQVAQMYTPSADAANGYGSSK